MTCYECVPTEAEVRDLHNTTEPLSRFMARVTMHLGSAPKKANPEATDAVSVLDAQLHHIKTSWHHRCHHFHRFQQACCRADAGGGGGSAAAAAPAEQEAGARKRKSAPALLEAQPPAARLRLQELHDSAASAIQAAEDTELAQPPHSSGLSGNRRKVADSFYRLSCCHRKNPQHLLVPFLEHIPHHITLYRNMSHRST